MKVFGPVAVGPIVNLFVAVGAFERIGLHSAILPAPGRLRYAGISENGPWLAWVGCATVEGMDRELGFDDEGQPVLITRAAYSYEEQHRARVRKYLTLMFWRIPAFLGAAIAYGIWHNGVVSLAILAASIPLPWMAVLIANDRPPRRAEEPRRYPDAPRHTALFPRATRAALEPGQDLKTHAAQPGDERAR